MRFFLGFSLIIALACSSNDGPPIDDGGSDTNPIDASFDGGDEDAGDDAGGDAGESDAGDDDAGGDDAGADDAGVDDAGDDMDAAADDAGPPMGTVSYLVFRDFRRCAAPRCGGFWVQAVNLEETVCDDRTTSADGCYVAGIDWSALGLGDDEVRTAEGSAGSLIIDGVLSTDSFEPGGIMLGSLRVEAAWGAPWGPAATRPSADTFYNGTDNGIACLVPPCFNFDLEVLNTSREDVVSTVDLSAPPASAEQRTLANNALREGNLRLAGDISTDAAPGPGGDFGETLEAVQFYLPILPE